MTETVANSFKDTYTRTIQVISDFLPNVLAALAIILVGWLVALLLSKIAGFVATKATKGLAHLKWLQSRSQQAPILQAIPTIVSKSVFWIVLLFSIAASGEVLGLSFASSILAQATAYLPRILVAVLIVILGILIAGTVGHLVERSLSKIGATYGNALGKVTQILIVILASIIGIEQLGINGTALTIIFSIVFGTSLGATALAFGLGAKTIIANMLSIQQVVKNYSIGDAVAIGELEGRILDFTQTAVLLETKRGRVLVPGKRFSEDFSIRIDSQT